MSCGRAEGIHREQAWRAGAGARQSESRELRHVPWRSQSARGAADRSAVSTMSHDAARGVQGGTGVENGGGLLHELPRAEHAGGETRMKKTLVALASEYMELGFLLAAASFVGYVIGYLLNKAYGNQYV